MKDRKLASRYARALLSALPSANLAEDVERFLDALRDAMEESADFRGLLLDPAVPRPTRKEILASIAQKAEMPRQLVNFLYAIVDHNRVAALPTIATVFHEERQLAAGIVEAEVTTAWPLSSDLERRTVQALERLTGRNVTLTTRVEPGLLGGAVTRIGSQVLDGSLRSQLDRLRQKMIEE
jgi:F-type H+-transporting ATPase subunit delta